MGQNIEINFIVISIDTTKFNAIQGFFVIS